MINYFQTLARFTHRALHHLLIPKDTIGKDPNDLLSTRLLMRAHQATNEGSDKSALYGNNVVGYEPDGGAHLSRNTDGQLGVLVAFVVVAALVYEVVVDVCGLHAGEDIEQEDGVGERRVLERADLAALAALACHIVGPLDHIRVGDLALAEALSEAVEGSYDVLAHQLPYQTESQCALTVGDISTLDTW